LKCFHNSTRTHLMAAALLMTALLVTVSALGELPAWIRNIEAGTAIENAFFRMMSVPEGAVMFRRPPRETRPALGDLIKAQPRNAELYSLRALEDEQQLEPAAAESDWKAYVDASSDKVNAQLALADFYDRRLRPADEIKTLSLVATAPSSSDEKLTPPAQQRSWQAFERIFTIIQAQGLPKDVSIAVYRTWIARYPQETSLYARSLQFLVAQKEYAAAGQLIADYHKQFPNDQIFPVKAKAMVQYRQGSVREGLAVYEQTFQPLWDPELVKSYFDLLRDTQNLRKFLDQAHAALNANPEDLNATARVFYYYQQQGKLEAAQQAITDLRLHKEASKSPWTSQDLYVCARLLEDIHNYPESARYYFALYNSQGMPDAQERAIAGLTNLLLTAPETPIRFGSGELSMYRDIATMDQGPGYLNGILSLILNTTEPASHYSEEEQRAVPYFHRSRAAELLALLDSRFPNSPQRPELHTMMLQFYAGAGESDAVIQGGHDFLANFPNAPQRTTVALLMADGYARKEDTKDEFAIYDSVLKELAAQAQNVPLGAATENFNQYRYSRPANYNNVESEEGSEGESGSPEANQARGQSSQAFQVSTATAPSSQAGPRSPEYARVLERYLARLIQLKQIPPALAVLRNEIDRNPDDPGLYERLALFLDQNRLGTEQEEIYRRAIARFSDRSWYDKLARFYLRHERDSEFARLTEDAIKTFSGTDLESYFNNVVGGSPQLYLRLNQYANRRFPHNPVFVQNLLMAYQRKETWDPAAWEALLRQHWFEEARLRDQFFEFLSRSNKLESELTALRQSAPDTKAWEANPAAANFLANGDLWRSHFEESAPVLRSLAAQYPAESELGRTASSVYRSLAYFDPADTAIAAGIEDNLSKAAPRDTQILARIGDIYADRDLFAKAAPYWERIPKVDPGQSAGYLEAATIYWDYFDFENAMRLLNEGREHLADPNLYAYEAGAIYENQRDYPRAIQEYLKGALASPGSQAESRLLTLARRPKYRDLVDQSTANIAPLPNPPMSAVNLRVQVLETQERKSDLESFLDAIANGTTSIEQAEQVENLAQQKSLEAVRQHALERQAALTTDPVTRLQLRYALIRLYEGRKDFPSAEKNVAALYQENPKILGVVRSTVDFYWRTKSYPKAISVLLQASKDAYPDLSKQFIYEGARKSTETAQYQQARDLLTKLLADAPYNGEYLAAMADTYAQAGDDHGLQQFYLEKIKLFRNAPLPADARKTQIATLRRGLIPALTRMKDYGGAVDQYIELINNFPEDDALVTEASLYALRYQRQQQLTDFYAKTVAQSPRDYRWSMVLARIQTNLENYPAAIDVYAKAIAIRPDRSDLYTARAGLEERLMRFDDAASDYERVYQLAYKDPQWMAKVAEVRARQGKTKEVVAALKTAYVEGRPENPSNYFEVAQRLETWGMLEEARGFAEQGIQAAGPDLLAVAEHHTGAKTYVRIMTRLRRHEQANTAMRKALDDASANLPVLKEQVARQGISGLTDAQWRNHTRDLRIQTARSGMTVALREMGTTVDSYFTPEERLAFAHYAESLHASMNLSDVENYAIPLARAANLADQETHWRFDVMMQDPRSIQSFSRQQQFVELQRQRTRFAELAGRMEQFSRVVAPGERNWPLYAAADAYRSAGDTQNELRVLATISAFSLDEAHQQRLFQLQLARAPQDLVQTSSVWNSSEGQKAADYIVAHGEPTLAHSMVQVRGKSRLPVWNKSYNALVGLYFAEPTPDVNKAFIGALGDQTIAQRLSGPADRSQQLAGNNWFYYGSRYGEYLGISKLDKPDDFLPAILEESPASSSGYLTLADYYAGAAQTKAAIADYDHTLELSPNRPDVYDSLALAYYKQGDRANALQQWKQAFATLTAQLNGARLPETFWADFGRTCDQLRTRHLFAELKPDADALLRMYLRRNGNYRSNALLHPAYLAFGDPAAATAWLLDVTSSAHDPTAILADVVDASWIPVEQRAPIYQRILQNKQDAVAKLNGLEHDYAQQDLDSWHVKWIGYLVRTKQYSQAADAIVTLSKESRDAQVTALVPLELRIAAQLGTLDAKITQYRAEPQTAPAPGLLRTAARQLFEAADKQSARKILEYVFAQEIDAHQLVATNFLGLAEIRLASGDTPGALDLLHRLVVVVGNPFENLDGAASLLEKTGHNAEAVEFLDQLVKSAPWDPTYRVRLAKAKIASGQDVSSAQDALASIGSDRSVAYAVRANAAVAMAGRSHADLGSGELNLLANPSSMTPAAADKFYFYEARVKAAQNAQDDQTKIQLLSHCVIDFPRRPSARYPLFEAQFRSQAYEPALATLENVFHAGGQPRQTETVGEDEILSADEQAEESDDHSPLPASNSVLSRAQNAHIAQMIGDTMIYLRRYSDALTYYDTARRLEPSAATRKDLARKIADVRETLRIQRLNAAHQPIMHEALEQDRVVRPRLMARVTPQPKPAARGGQKQ
jgi:predicted Zn-dependent protease